MNGLHHLANFFHVCIDCLASRSVNRVGDIFFGESANFLGGGQKTVVRLT